MAPKMISLTSEKRKHVPESYDVASIKDLLWMTENFIFPLKTPMWARWNSLYSSDNTITEKIWYLPQINQSPTSTDVVKETLKRAQQIAKECHKNEIAVTYDLAIAKIALEIQTEEAARFDNVFVALGSFHVEMSYFGVIGKYIAESGGPHLLNECHIIEHGSLTSFLSGKGYTRAKRIHEMFALGMEITHFKSFQLTLDEEDLMVIEELQEYLTLSKSEKAIKLSQMSVEVIRILDKYKIFVKDTMDGKYGKTAKYWMGYIKMVHLYHEFA